MLVFVRMLRRLGPDRLAPAVVTAEEANAVTIGCVNRRVGVGISCVPGRYLPVKQGVDGLFVGAQIVVCGSGRVVAGHCHLCPRWFLPRQTVPSYRYHIVSLF